jgi:hypothetical protein
MAASSRLVEQMIGDTTAGPPIRPLNIAVDIAAGCRRAR